MSNVIKPPAMPPQPATTKLSEAEIQKELLNKVLLTMQEGFARQDARADDQDDRLDHIERQVSIAVEDGKDNNKRITALEVRFEDEVRRAGERSMRVRQESDVNLKQEGAIANIMVDMAATKGAVSEVRAMLVQNNTWTKALVDAGKGIFLKYPKLETALIALIISALVWGASWFQSKGH